MKPHCSIGRRFRVAATALVLVLAAGCSGDDEGAREEPTKTVRTAESRQFREFRIVLDTGLDSLDPSLSYTVQGWQTMWHVYLPLLGYKHVSGPDGATIVPVLAEELPEVSSDGRTYELTLRERLRYSDGEPVKASDFEFAIKRLFQVASPAVGFFTDIEGAQKYAELSPAEMRRADISGITVDDLNRKITIKLAKPRGDFQNILATTFAAPIPAATPAREQFTLPATGPYRIARYRPLRGFTLVRNPHFVPTQHVPRPNADTVTATITGDANQALQSVLRGRADYDFHPIPQARFAAISKQHRDRLKVYTPPNTYYFFMNTRTPPFDKVEVRRAVNYAIDRRELVRLYGGLASPTENVLPPTYQAYEKHTLYPYDVEKARELIDEAGARGARVTVWGSNRDTVRPQVTYLNKVLNSIGLRSELRIVDVAIYWGTIGNQTTKAQIGFAHWFQDYPHPLNWFDVLLNGNRITQRNNNNYSNADIDSINDEIEDLKQEPELTDEINRRWADLDREVMEEALWAPFVNKQFVEFFGEDVDLQRCYVNHVVYQLDISRICKK